MSRPHGIRDRTVRLTALILLAAATPAVAQVEPDPIIAPVVFHWPQVQTAWPTLEGGSVAAGSVRFWRRQITLFELAGFTAQLFQVVHGAVTSQRNHLTALRDRRNEQPGGPPPPRVVPFFSAETFPEYFAPKDVLSAGGFEEFYQAIRAWFTMYGEYFPARPGQRGPLDTDMLAKVDRRILITLWWVPLRSYNLPATFFRSLSDRLERDFGFRAYWSVHEWFAKGGPDDVNYLFNGPAPIQRGLNSTYPAVDLLVAFWPPDASYPPGLFVPRSGGTFYAAAWDAVIASSPAPSIVFIESYNEITEGSHLMPSFPISHAPGDGHWTGPGDDPICGYKPCHPLEFTDTWGGDNPWLYLDLTRRKIREWLVGPPLAGEDLVPPHVFILTPKTDEGGGGALPIEIVAADDRALNQVTLYLDGAPLVTTKGSIYRTLKSWNLKDGRHTLYVEAFDEAGNRDTDFSDFVVRNSLASLILTRETALTSPARSFLDAPDAGAASSQRQRVLDASAYAGRVKLTRVGDRTPLACEDPAGALKGRAEWEVLEMLVRCRSVQSR